MITHTLGFYDGLPHSICENLKVRYLPFAGATQFVQAEAQGNSEAAARYRQAVSLQRQIYRERAEQEERAEKARAENPQAGLAAAFEAAPPKIGIPLSDLQRLIEARDKRVSPFNRLLNGDYFETKMMNKLNFARVLS